MYLVFQQISKNEWRLNAKNADEKKAMKAYAGCVKSVGVNKCRLTEEIRPKLDIKAFVVEEEAEKPKPTIMKFVGEGTELPKGDWIRVTPDFNPELRDFCIGTPLQYDGARKKWEIWDGEGQPGGSIEEHGKNPELLKIVVHRHLERQPAVPEYTKFIRTRNYGAQCKNLKEGAALSRLPSNGAWVPCLESYPDGVIWNRMDSDGYIVVKVYENEERSEHGQHIIRTSHFGSRVTDMHPKGTALTKTDEGLWTLAGHSDDIHGEIHSAPSGGMRLLDILVFDASKAVSSDSHAPIGHYPEQLIKTKELDGSCAYGEKGHKVTTLEGGKWVLYGGPNPKGEIEEPIDENGYLTIKVYAGFQG